MSLPALAFVPLAGDAAPAVSRVPAAPGVGQILGPGGTSLLLAPASNLRRWAAAHLGLGKPAAPGRRPKTNLAGLATAIGWAEVDAPFRQRLLYERLVAPLVPLSSRRELKPPAFLHLDPAQRFPRVTVRAAAENEAALFGPFGDRRAAGRRATRCTASFPCAPATMRSNRTPHCPSAPAASTPRCALAPPLASPG